MPMPQGRTQRGRFLLRAVTFWSSSALAAGALLFNAVLPGSAQSQINGRVISAPQFPSAPRSVAQPKLPKAPLQVAMPALPPIKYVPGMEEPLVATGPVDAQESAELDAALKAFHDTAARAGADSDYDDYAKPLLAFVASRPKSNWNSALQLDLGLGYYHAGYWSRAFAAFEESWRLGRNANTPQARLMVDRAVGELAKMHARVGHEKELTALFADMGKRPVGGPATELIQGAREGLWTFHHNPGEGYLCGPKALGNVLKALKAGSKQIQVAEDARSGPHGFSLPQLATLADKAKLKYTLIYRAPGQPIPVPSVINWKVHHYAAIVGKQGNLYQVIDPTFGSASGGLLTAKAIDAEGSGYFLVPAQAADAKAGWRRLSPGSAEAKAVYGMGTASSCIAGAMMTTDHHMCNGCGSDAPSISPPMTSGIPSSTGDPALQMTVANASTMVVSLSLSDTPVGYQPQKGVSARTQIAYNQREDQQPATLGFSNVSSKWTHSWLAFLQDDPGVNREGWNVMRYGSGGGGFNYLNIYNRTTGTWPAETYDNAQLFRFPVTGPATSYERHLPDGSKEVYAKFDGATTFPRHVFLTQVIDAAGNTTTLNYDSQLRLTSVVDAMGRSTTFTYGISANPLLITQITDPFGRASQMTYDTSARLASITDPAGITSSFTYSSTEPTFVNTLTTPYGTSTFSDTPNPHDTAETNTRSLTLTDPLGFTDFLYFYQNPSIVPASDPAATLPSGMTVYNNLLQWRNLFYWDKHAFALGVTTSGGVVQSEDFTKARITHWDHDINVQTDVGRVSGSIKPPLEHRTWYTYWGHNTSIGPEGTIFSGTLDRPDATGRVLDDGTSQVTKASYNSFGLPMIVTDPKGRATQYTYASNNVDLLTVQQLTTAPSTYTTIATFGSYNALHEPQTYTDAAGQVWHFTYNAVGQPATVTDPNGGVTTRNYDSSGRLSSITNANSQTQVSYTYDSADRILTRTDSEGYTLTYAYDALDRVTSITYPDGTTDSYDYTFQSGPLAGTQSLEVRKHTDRLGRVTTYGYDADRRLTSVTEPTSGTGTRTTSYDYYENGTLKDITDANGNVTHWDIDIESRPTKKTYAFGTSSAQAETYTYETSTSRLKSITDANGQTKTFTYDIDDKVKGFTYTGAINPTPNVTFTWDPFFPRMSSMTDGLGTTNYAYTAIGTNGALKLASIDGPFANDVISLTYDALGRINGRNITGGNETFGYDAINRLTTHGTPLGSFTNTYLGQTDQITGRSVTNGSTTVSTSWGYDTNANDRRLISISNSGVTRSFTLSYLNGTTPNPYDIMGITDTAATGHPFASQTHGYGYDNVDRLLSATQTAPGNYSYGYDNLDNATSVTDPAFGSITPTYNGLNQVQAFNTNTYSYDNNGNTTSDGLTKTYKWDAENRLIEIDYIGTSNKSVFSYDGLGHRTVDAETVSGVTTTTRYLWCSSRVCQVRDGSDNVQSRILDEGEYNVISSQKAVYMLDQLASVRDVLDGTTGNLLSSIDYSPYGARTQTNGSFTPLYQYAGLVYHPQSGLSLSTTRAYDSTGQRWLSRDPIKELGGINLYAYVKANTINYFDPLGLIFKPGGNYVVPIDGPSPLDPAGLNTTPLTPQEQQQIADTFNQIRQGDFNGLSPHPYQNLPDKDTGAQLPACGHERGYESFKIPGSIDQRILIGGRGQYFYTNNHYKSFYPIDVIPPSR